MSPSNVLRALAFLGILGLAVGSTPAGAQGTSFPKLVNIGTNSPGTVFYALGSGLAKVVSAAAPFQMGVQPYTGTSTFLPLLNSGELDFGVINAVDTGLAYQGPQRLKVGGRNPFPHVINTRLAMRGAPQMISLLVIKDSPFRSIHDLKGKRVTGEYPAHLAAWVGMFGALASAGLTWSDIKVVPVPAVNEGLDALVQGRADLSFHALNAAKVKEADATRGVRHLSIDCSPQGQERLKTAVPGYYPRNVKPGEATAVVEETCAIAYDLYLVTHRGLPNVVVYATLNAIWENIDKLPPLHPGFKEWTRERAVDPGVTTPYHPGAVQFYRERGLWSIKMDDVQQKLLALDR